MHLLLLLFMLLQLLFALLLLLPLLLRLLLLLLLLLLMLLPMLLLMLLLLLHMLLQHVAATGCCPQNFLEFLLHYVVVALIGFSMILWLRITLYLVSSLLLLMFIFVQAFHAFRQSRIR